MSREDPQLKIRLSPELKTRVENSAMAFGRTMNADIVARLQTSFEPSSTEQLRDLQLELARAQTEALTAKQQALHYSMALMVIGSRIPPEVLADAPAIADLLNSLNTGSKAKLVETAKNMLGDASKMAASIAKLGELERALNRK